jgi:hypothetical protein
VDDPAQIPLIETPDFRQKQKLFLKIGRQLQELHDLAHARACYTTQLSKLRIILNGFIFNESLQSYGECHQPGDPRNEGVRIFNLFWIAISQFPAGEQKCDFLAGVHSRTPGSGIG